MTLGRRNSIKKSIKHGLCRSCNLAQLLIIKGVKAQGELKTSYFFHIFTEYGVNGVH